MVKLQSLHFSEEYSHIFLVAKNKNRGTIDISVRDRGLGVRDRQGHGEPRRDAGATGRRPQVVLDRLLAVRLPRRPGRPRRLDPVRDVRDG